MLGCQENDANLGTLCCCKRISKCSADFWQMELFGYQFDLVFSVNLICKFYKHDKRVSF